MMQFLNNVWIALSSENPELVHWLLIPFTFIENYLFMMIFLIIFNVNYSKKQKFLYVVGISVFSILNSKFTPSPLNILLNYICIILLIKFIFKLNLLKSFTALILSTSIFSILSMLIQNPYLTIFNISFDTFTNVPIYRLPYLLLLYLFVLLVCIFFKKFKTIKFNLEELDTLDNHTLKLLSLNLILGFLVLCIQLITTAFYIDIVPIIITILNFILLVSFLLLSIYSFTRMVKLATARRELASAEEYNKSLEILYDKVKGFKHDFENIVSTLDGYIEDNDMPGLKEYFDGIKKDCKITNNLSVINPRVINNPGIYSLLNNKYFRATNSGITFEIEFFLDLNTLEINMYKFSRILGVLLDNAIEEAEKCDEKFVKISFLRENRNNRAVITVKNTYSNKNVDIEKIFEKGESGKENHSGIGLWEVKKYVKKSKNLDLNTSKTDKYFIQEFFIYDL